MSSSLGKSLQRSKRLGRIQRNHTSSGAVERWGDERAALLEAEAHQAQRCGKEAVVGGPSGKELKSIWECTALENFLDIADARERGYEAERDTKVLFTNGTSGAGGGQGRYKVSAPLLRVRRMHFTPGQTGLHEMRERNEEEKNGDEGQEESERSTRPTLPGLSSSAGTTTFASRKTEPVKGSVEWWETLHAALTIPKRPAWDHHMTAEAVKATERKAFVDWRRSLSVLEEQCEVVMTPYEKNLEVWRQLWRVVERSDIVLELVDARNPLVYRSYDFESYVAHTPHPRTKKGKQLILLLNKADLLTEYQRRAWATYFEANGQLFFFFSAKASMTTSKPQDSDEDSANEEREDEERDEEEEEDVPRGRPARHHDPYPCGSPPVDRDLAAAAAGATATPSTAARIRHRKKKLRGPVHVANDPYALAENRRQWKERQGVPKEKVPAPLTEEERQRNERLQQYTTTTMTMTSTTRTTPKETSVPLSPSLPPSHGEEATNRVQRDRPLASTAMASPRTDNGTTTSSSSSNAPVVLPVHPWTVLSPIQLLDQLSLFRPLCGLPIENEEHAPTEESLMVGLVGYPNVGKSSTINAIIGAKKVMVSITPGKTKHFQTLPIPQERRIMLCDCPGLVFPSFATTKWEMLCDGILAADHTTDATEAISVICRRLPRALLEHRFHLSLCRTEDSDALRMSLAERLLHAYASRRGYEASHGRLDLNRAAKELLKLYVDGGLVFASPPPGYKPARTMVDVKDILQAGKSNATPATRRRHTRETATQAEIKPREKDGEWNEQEWEDVSGEEEDDESESDSLCSEEEAAWKALDEIDQNRGFSDNDEDDNDAARSVDSEVHEEEVRSLLPFFFGRPPHVQPHAVTRSEAFNWEANQERIEAILQCQEKEEAYRRARRRPLHGQLATDVPDTSTFINRRGEVELRLDDEDGIVELAPGGGGGYGPSSGAPAPVIVGEKKLSKHQLRRQQKKNGARGALKVASVNF